MERVDGSGVEKLACWWGINGGTEFRHDLLRCFCVTGLAYCVHTGLLYCVSRFRNCCTRNLQKHGGYCEYMDNISWPDRVINGGLLSLGGILNQWSRIRSHIRKLCTYHKNYRVITLLGIPRTCIFPRVTRKTAHNNKCVPLPWRGLSPMRYIQIEGKLIRLVTPWVRTAFWNMLLKEVTGIRQRRRNYLLDDIKKERGCWKLKEGSARSHCVQNSLWKL